MTDHFDENFALVIEEERETITPKKNCPHQYYPGPGHLDCHPAMLELQYRTQHLCLVRFMMLLR